MSTKNKRYKEKQMEIIELRNTITKILKLMDGFSSRVEMTRIESVNLRTNQSK